MAAFAFAPRSRLKETSGTRDEVIGLFLFVFDLQSSIVPERTNGVVGANLMARKEDRLVLRFTPETVALVLDLQFACPSTVPTPRCAEGITKVPPTAPAHLSSSIYKYSVLRTKHPRVQVCIVLCVPLVVDM